MVVLLYRAIQPVLDVSERKGLRRNSNGKGSSRTSLCSDSSTSSITTDSADLPPPVPAPSIIGSTFKMEKFEGRFLKTIDEPGESRDDYDSYDSDDILLVDNALDGLVEEDDEDDEEDEEETPYATLTTLGSGPITKPPPVKLLVAHVGDCRAVLSDAGVAVQLTVDHHPDVPSEKERVEAAGGWISKNRVNGVLAVTRSFGDIMYKTFDPTAPSPDFYGDEEELETGIWAKRNQVISMPEILELDVQSSYEFIILASDGLFESFSCSQIVSFVRDELFKHGDSQRAARAAISEVEARGGHDNTSLVVVCLNQISRDRQASGASNHSGRTNSSGLARPRSSDRAGSSESYMSDI